MLSVRIFEYSFSSFNFCLHRSYSQEAKHFGCRKCGKTGRFHFNLRYCFSNFSLAVLQKAIHFSSVTCYWYVSLVTKTAFFISFAPSQKVTNNLRWLEEKTVLNSFGKWQNDASLLWCTRSTQTPRKQYETVKSWLTHLALSCIRSGIQYGFLAIVIV